MPRVPTQWASRALEKTIRALVTMNIHMTSMMDGETTMMNAIGKAMGMIRPRTRNATAVPVSHKAIRDVVAILAIMDNTLPNRVQLAQLDTFP
jgi:glycine cleavage system pyridoxal-binding protein P